MSEGIAVIPALERPRREVSLLEPVGGRALLRWSVDAAVEAVGVGRTYVMTAGGEIGAWVEVLGGVQVVRPRQAKGPERGLISQVEWLRGEEPLGGGVKFAPVVILDPWSPLRRVGEIERAMAMLGGSGVAAVVAARRIQGMVWESADGRGSKVWRGVGKTHDNGRADGFRGHEETGSYQVVRGDWLWGGNSLGEGDRVIVQECDLLDGHSIETLEDLARVDMLLRLGERPGTPSLDSIRLLIFDFDGVMTDNRVLVDQEGREAVLCHRGDGWGLGRLRGRAPEVLVISTEANPVVGARCRKLKLGYIQNCDDKLRSLQVEAERRRLGPEAIAYVGNDLNDLTCMQWVGLPIAVADAMPEIVRIARRVTTRLGGFGAVREVVDWFVGASPGR